MKMFLSLLLLPLLAQAQTTPRPDWLELATQDATSRAVMEKALGKLGLKNFDDLIGFVSECDTTKLNSTQNGETRQNGSNSTIYATEFDLRSGKQPEEYFRERIAAETLKVKGYGARITEIQPDYVRARTWLDPGICLRPGLGMIQQYTTFMHELTHMVETDQLEPEDMLSYADFDDFALKTILRKGSEVDAYIAGTGAHLRIVNSLDDIGKPFRPFFDEEGHFTSDRTAFGRVILAPRPEGMGYADRHYRKRYETSMRAAFERETQTRANIAKLAESRLRARNMAAHTRLTVDLAARDVRLAAFAEKLKPVLK